MIKPETPPGKAPKLIVANVSTTLTGLGRPLINVPDGADHV